MKCHLMATPVREHHSWSYGKEIAPVCGGLVPKKAATTDWAQVSCGRCKNTLVYKAKKAIK